MLEKKFSKISNKTVKIPSRNASSAKNSFINNTLHENTLTNSDNHHLTLNKNAGSNNTYKKSSIIEIKEKVKLSLSQKGKYG